MKNFFCDPVVLELICCYTRPNRLINESKTTGWLRKMDALSNRKKTKKRLVHPTAKSELDRRLYSTNNTVTYCATFSCSLSTKFSFPPFFRKKIVFVLSIGWGIFLSLHWKNKSRERERICTLSLWNFTETIAMRILQVAPNEADVIAVFCLDFCH